MVDNRAEIFRLYDTVTMLTGKLNKICEKEDRLKDEYRSDKKHKRDEKDYERPDKLYDPSDRHYERSDKHYDHSDKYYELTGEIAKLNEQIKFYKEQLIEKEKEKTSNPLIVDLKTNNLSNKITELLFFAFLQT